MSVVTPPLATVVAALALAGCYSPSPPSGAPCDPATPNCPSGQTCTQTAGGAFCLRPGETIDGLDGGVDTTPEDDLPSDMDSTSDLDSDGVLDGMDNCPDVENSGQENDDGDSFGDACDPCPPYSDPLPLQDPDGDNVTGRCDPNPAVGGDRIIYFTTFTQLPGNAAISGTISLVPASGGRISMTAPEAASASLTIPEPATARFSVITELVGTDVNLATGSSNIAAFGPVIRKAGTADNGITCAVVVDATGAGTLALANIGTDTNLDTTPYGVMVLVPYTMTLTRADNVYTCSSQTSGAIGATTLQATASVSQPDARAGVRIQAGDGNVRWMLLVDRP